MKYIKYICVVGLFIIIVIAIYCIYFTDNFSQINIDEEKYVAVEEDFIENGTIIVGNNPVPMEMPGRPIFYYNRSIVTIAYNSTGKYPKDYPEMNQSLLILLGKYHIINAPEHTIPTLQVSGIYTLPDDSSEVSIIGVDNNGAIKIEYGFNVTRLSPGESWTSPTIAVRNQTYIGEYRGINYSFTTQYSSSITVTNIGIYDKY